MKEWKKGMSEWRARRTREHFRRMYGRNLGGTRHSIRPYGRSASTSRKSLARRQRLHRVSRSMQEEWAAEVSQWVARREIERVNLYFRRKMGILKGHSTDEWNEGYGEWQDRALMSRAWKWLRRPGKAMARSQTTRLMVLKVRESVDHSIALRNRRQSQREAAGIKHHQDAEPERERQASVENLLTKDSYNEQSPTEISKEAKEGIRGHEQKDEQWGEESVEECTETPNSSESFVDMAEGASTAQSKERGKGNLQGFLFRLAVPFCLGLMLVLYLCDLLNQRMGWNIPVGLDLMGIETDRNSKTESLDDREGSNNEALPALISKKEQRHPYLVVDISRGPEAANYPIAFHGKLPVDWNSTTYRTNKILLKWIEPGTFEMGREENKNSNPSHKVTLDRGGYIGIFEVTGTQYAKVMGNDPSGKGGGVKPVEQVSWETIRGGGWPNGLPATDSFMGKLRSKTNRRLFDLPTEAQWEYACRAGTKTLYSFGDSYNELKNFGWFKDNAGSTTHAVGMKKPNPWGLYDVHGNVFELVLDYYDSFAPKASLNPVGPVHGSDRIRRGGAWIDDSGWSTSYARAKGGGSWDIVGFRLVMNLFREEAGKPINNQSVYVNFPDPKLRLTLMEILRKKSAGITVADMKNLKALDLDGKQISDLRGLEHATNLISLKLNQNTVSDLSPLAGLTKLQTLESRDNQIVDVAPLKGLVALHRLFLSSNNIESIETFSRLSELVHLKIERNQIVDLGPLKDATKLSLLYASDNKIFDLSPLSGLLELQLISASRNSISDIAPLERMTGMKNLFIQHNLISDISKLSGMSELNHLWMDNNQISNIEPLKKLNKIINLHINNNTIKDITPLKEMTGMQSLHIQHNLISDISPIKTMSELSALWMEGNQISNTEPLSKLNKIVNLQIHRNKIKDITPLKGMKGMKHLHIQHNLISDVSPLENMTEVEHLWMENNQISTIEPLGKLNRIVNLQINNNRIKDITPLKEMTGMKHLYIHNNQISDVSPLENMTEVEHLWMENNQISTIEPLRKLNKIESLHINRNKIKDITPLEGMKGMKHLHIQHNLISDISPLKTMSELNNLWISSNPTTTIEPLKQLINIAHFESSNNKLKDITPLANMKAMRHLRINNNLIEDIKPLAGMFELNSLFLGSNNISSIQALKSFKRLENLEIQVNKISDLLPLKDLKGLTRLVITGNPIQKETKDWLKKSFPQCEIRD